MSQTSLFSPSPVSLPPITYKGTPAITTERLAQVYGCDPKQIRQNFANNRGRFIEGKHFYTLTNNELKDFRLCVENFDSQISPKIRNLTLYTERGALQHAKSIGSDETWAIYDVLVETFFRVVKPAAPTPLPRLSKRTDPERKALSGLVSAWVGVAPFDYRTCWKQVSARFGVEGVDALTVPQIKDACAWVQERINECAAQPKTLPFGRMESNVVLAGTPAFWEMELEKLLATLLEWDDDVYERLNAFDRELRRIAMPLYRMVLDRLPVGPERLRDHGMNALSFARRAGTGKIRDGFGDLMDGVKQAAWFAKTLKV